MTLLEVRDLGVTFQTGSGPVSAVRSLNLAVGSGQCVALVGESGSGKSVTARAILGLTGRGSQLRGSIQLHGRELRSLSERQWRAVRGRQIAIVLQDALTSLDPLRRVGAEVAEPLAIHHLLRRGERPGAVRALLSRVGVPHPRQRARQYPHELSGGLRQRALIASSIAAAPELIIADEPTTALDVTVQAQLLGLLGELKAAGTGIVLISHDLAVVAALADKIVVLREGEVVEAGGTADILRRPRAEYTRELLRAIPTRASRGRSLQTGEPLPAPPERGEVVLHARGLTKTFHSGGLEVTALDGVDIDVHGAQAVGVVGESGSGKSTLARVLLGLVEPDSGAVELQGRPWSGLRERDRRERRGAIQIVSQDPLGSFDPRHTCGRLLSDALRAAGGTVSQVRVAELLDQVGLPASMAGRDPMTLSGGQRQRVAIARTLAFEPAVLICDEAVSALDVSVQAQILDLLAQLRRSRGLALVFISHDLGVIQHLVDDVLVMKDGVVVESGPVEQVLTLPEHPYTQVLIDSIPTMPSPAAPTTKDSHAPNRPLLLR